VLATFAPRQDVPSQRENVRDPLRELDRGDRGETFEADLPSIRDSLSVLQHHISAIKEALDGDFQKILSELEKIAEKVNQPSKKHQSDQRTFIEKLIDWVAMKSISFRSISHPVFRDMIQLFNPNFSVPV
jgi:archaellum component FlaC